MSKAIGVITNQGVEWHAYGAVHDYVTLCGMDGNDPAVDQFGTVGASRGQKITCAQCLAIFRAVRELRLTERDFDC